MDARVSIRPRRVSPFERVFAAYVRTLRLAAYFAFVAIIITLVAARSLYAEAREATRAVNKNLSQLEDITTEADIIRVNGAVIHRASTFSKESVDVILERVEAHCADSPSALMEYVQSRADGMKSIGQSAPPGIRRGVIRDVGGEESTIACIVGRPTSKSESLIEQVERFSKTMDIATFGDFRFVRVQKVRDGVTHVITEWTEGKIEIPAIFPKEGDAAGADPDIAPRPAKMRRLISAAADGQRAGVWVFESHEELDGVRAAYRTLMHDKGFDRVTLPNPNYDQGDAFLREDGSTVTVSYTAGPEKKSLLTIVQGGRSGRGQIAKSTVSSAPAPGPQAASQGGTP